MNSQILADAKIASGVLLPSPWLASGDSLSLGGTGGSPAGWAGTSVGRGGTSVIRGGI